MALGPHIYLWNAGNGEIRQLSKIRIYIYIYIYIYTYLLFQLPYPFKYVSFRFLVELESPEDYVCSVRWIKEGNVLAVGNLFGEIALYDVEQMKKMR